ncbi:acyltransferase [Arthrobacter rhombi]|uniref:acyltransferase n=1 Tax=Arthrobacter rhombi TaxID=71253 RepID=UPI003FD4A877
MIRITELSNFEDADGNKIEFDGIKHDNIRIKFSGRNNVLIVHREAKIGKLAVDFDCDNGRLVIGKSRGVPALVASIRIGQDSSVLIDENVSMTAQCVMSATEGTTITVGRDVMFASDNQVRADDGHAIFDVVTGKRINVSKDISIGNHVWISRGASILGGVTIGDGSIIGFGSIVTNNVPNNCVAAGVPARVVRKNAAWERAHLSMTKPFYKRDASDIRKSRYWATTEATESAESSGPTAAAWIRDRALKAAKRVWGLASKFRR